MAGDWIKMEHATAEKPEILRTAELLDIHRDAAIGLYFRFWVWLDRNLSSGECPDLVRNMSRHSLDDIMRTQGFSACLVAVGWAEFDDEAVTLRIIHAERHNGNTAKTRALDAKRKKVARSEMSVLQPDKIGTREEKRREDINRGSNTIVSNNTSEGSPPVDNFKPTFRESNSQPRAAAHSEAKTRQNKAELAKAKENMAPLPDWAKKFVRDPQ